jgi:hypothetical protein
MTSREKCELRSGQIRAHDLEESKALVSVKLESRLEWFAWLKGAVASEVHKLVVSEAVDDRGWCRSSGDETCDLSIESLDDLDLAAHSRERGVRLRYKKYGRAIRISQIGNTSTGLDKSGQRWGIGRDVEVQEIAWLAVFRWDWSHGMERKGTKHRCRAPPDAGLFFNLKHTESFDDRFANELVELLENGGKGFIVLT